MFLQQKHDNCMMTEETDLLADCFGNKSSLQFFKYIIITLKVERRIKAILNLPIKSSLAWPSFQRCGGQFIIFGCDTDPKTEQSLSNDTHLPLARL